MPPGIGTAGKGTLMSEGFVRRGFDPEDRSCFSAAALPLLRRAAREIEWLLDRGYARDPVLALVGGHHQLTIRQRQALLRSTASTRQYRHRRETMRPWRDAASGPLLLDGFNLLITLETALSGSLLLMGGDGVIRDLAGLRGTYRLIAQTDMAIDLLGAALDDLAVPEVRILLDQPVSNSGRLRQRILERSAGWPTSIDVALVTDPDPLLASGDRIVTADSRLLDACGGWFNLAHRIVGRSIPDAWVVQFREPGDEQDDEPEGPGAGE